MARNLATSLRCKNRAHPMDNYDRLPPELRAWLSRAALPWSAHSVARLWTRLLRELRGDRDAALARLDRAEHRMLARDGPRIWGNRYPLHPPAPKTAGSPATSGTHRAADGRAKAFP